MGLVVCGGPLQRRGFEHRHLLLLLQPAGALRKGLPHLHRSSFSQSLAQYEMRLHPQFALQAPLCALEEADARRRPFAPYSRRCRSTSGTFRCCSYLPSYITIIPTTQESADHVIIEGKTTIEMSKSIPSSGVLNNFKPAPWGHRRQRQPAPWRAPQCCAPPPAARAASCCWRRPPGCPRAAPP